MTIYLSKDVCAIVVTYNPDDRLLDNIRALCAQDVHVLIVDNYSRDRKALADVISILGANNLIQLPENKGIAYALNKGVEFCFRNGYDVVLTMDQDTILDGSCVKELLKVINSGAHSAGINWDNKSLKDERVDFLITSGNMVLLDCLNIVGGFDEKLFIDCVDFDLSLRLKEKGFKLVKVALARADHRIGQPKIVKKFGITFTYSEHSEERHYYIARNHYYILKKYRKHVLFCMKKRLNFFLDIWKVLLFDRNWRPKILAAKRGKDDWLNMR